MTQVSRRGFLKGAAFAAGGAVAVGLGACAPKDNLASTVSDNEAKASEADPIEPAAVPDNWNMEADIVVVGMGGGGVNAAAYAAEQGASVIAIEKSETIGGASAHAGSIFNVVGGTKSQNEAQYGWPQYPAMKPEDAIGYIQKDFNYTLDDKMMTSWLSGGIEAIDWMESHPESSMQLFVDPEMPGMSFFWASKQFMTGETGSYILGMKPVVEGMASVAEAHGAQILTSTACKTFVQDQGRIVGVVAERNGDEVYIKAAKGVILTAGGFGMNLDMLEKWIPTAYRGAASGGPMPSHTGEVTRMALGVGADMAGFDSWSAWHGFIDEARNGDRGDGEFWHYFYHGERQLVANPWLTIDRMGNRVPYYVRDPVNGSEQKMYQKDFFDTGDIITAGSYMGRIGGRSFQIFDADYPTNVFKLVDSYGPAGHLDQNKCPFTADSEVPEEALGLVSKNWEAEVQEVIDRGGIQTGNTLEELAENMGLDPDVVVNAVNRWNELCEQGEDTDLTIPYDPAWLIPVKNPPYYGACVSGCISKTLCGLRVDENLQVIDTAGHPIPGLYAGFSTAGGFAGESCYAGDYNPTIFGACGASFVSGYIAAKAALSA